MRSRLVPLYLPKSEYDQLCEVAKAEERDPLQQARWILRQALAPELREQPDVAQQTPAVVQEAAA